MQRATVLVVDDEPAVAEIVERYLAMKGHDAVCAGSAEEAAELLRGRRFDFVLLDVVLPGRTGLQSLAALRALTTAPIHMMSGLSDDGCREDARILGAAGFFAKPLELPLVAAAIEALPGPRA